MDYKKAFELRWQSARRSLAHFNEIEWMELQQLKERLGECTVREAVDFFLEHGAGRRGAPMFSSLVPQRLEDLRRLDSPTLGRAELYLKRFIDHAGDRPLHLYAREDVQNFIDYLVAKDLARPTIQGHILQVRKIFNDALADGMIQRSPAQRIQLPSTRGEKRMTLMSPEDLGRLLQVAWEKDRVMAGLLAILFFLGMRISMIAVPPAKRKRKEFLRLDMIDRENRFIDIPAGIMKSEANLLIEDVPECIWPWIAHLKKNHFGMPQETFNTRRGALCKAAGFTWQPNIHRRSAASYLAAIHGAEKASEIIGDKTRSIFAKHYRVPAFKAVAEEYFRIYPVARNAPPAPR